MDVDDENGKAVSVRKGEFVVLHDEYIENAPLYKYCLLCNTLQPIEHFHKHARLKSGRQGECISCKTRYNDVKNGTRTSDQHFEAAQKRRLLIEVAGSARVDRKTIEKKYGYRCFVAARICERPKQIGINPSTTLCQYTICGPPPRIPERCCATTATDKKAANGRPTSIPTPNSASWLVILALTTVFCRGLPVIIQRRYGDSKLRNMWTSFWKNTPDTWTRSANRATGYWTMRKLTFFSTPPRYRGTGSTTRILSGDR